MEDTDTVKVMTARELKNATGEVVRTLCHGDNSTPLR